MKVAFRLDASGKIGTGHFMRCITLANGLKGSGTETRFLCRNLPEYLKEMLACNEHEYAGLDNRTIDRISFDLDHSHWLETSQEIDALDSINVLSDKIWDWIVVDHYALDARWERTLRKVSKNILVIDDIADREHDCDVLLDVNLYHDMEKRYTNKIPSHCSLLVGPHYALLRDEFCNLHRQIQPRSGPVKHVLVCFGGVDTCNYTGYAIQALADIGLQNVSVDVVIGKLHPYRQEIDFECSKNGFSCHIQTTRLGELMAKADFAIGSGGSAIWERCCLGLPTLVVGIADNQLKQIADAAEEGLLYAPELKGNIALAMKKHIEALLENEYLRRLISRKSIKVVDGLGTSRVVQYLKEFDGSNIEIREACKEDSKQIFVWRNHPTIRLMSSNPNTIEWDEHLKWFERVLSSNDRLLLIGIRNGNPVGVVRFDVKEDLAEVSIYLSPEMQGRGLGPYLLRKAEYWLVTKKPGISVVCARVIANNKRSQNLFVKSGYMAEMAFFIKRFKK